MDEDIYYQALISRDNRFDGVFYVGVTSTGIYCRPICPARTPKRVNCKIFTSAEAAEKEHFRPCLRCRPELAPGNAPIDDSHRIANLLIARIEEDHYGENVSLEKIAHSLGLSSRQIRRIIQKEFGVSPIELVSTRRLLLAKQLLTDTDLSITDIAFASCFSSLRRFNDAFKTKYGMPPSNLRKGIQNAVSPNQEKISLKLSYRPPYDWEGILKFLAFRAIHGIEHVTDKAYSRTVKIGKISGWFKVLQIAEKHSLQVEISLSLIPVLAYVLGKIRNIFDLNARPDVISAHLSQDSKLAKQVMKNPGLRVPGAFDGFELAIRAILGQQVTVRAATVIATRFVKAFGEQIETPFSELVFLMPTPEKIAKLKVEQIAENGVIRTRANSIIELAKLIACGELQLSAGIHPEKMIDQLITIPGIGKWTAHYIAMRTLRWPDAFPKEDVALRKALGGVTPKQAEELSQPWRPWRSYALLHLWHSLG